MAEEMLDKVKERIVEDSKNSKENDEK